MNWRCIKHVGIKEIRNTAYICDMKGCKTAVIFAVNGVTRDAQGEIERLSKVNLQILCITKEELLLLNSNQDCTDLLLRKLFENKSFSENEILV